MKGQLLLARVRWIVGTRRQRIARALRHPIRFREPLFSPARECRRALARRDAIVLGNKVDLGDWETHTPVLAELLTLASNARVLELGVGFGSTPLTLALSDTSVSLETDAHWHARFARYASQRHRVLLWDDITELEWRCPFFDERWDVAVIDNAPARSRQSNLEKLANRVRFLVCHDTQEVFRPSPSDYRWDFSAFQFVWTYTQFGTYTTVVSNVEDIPLEHLPGTRTVPSSRYSGGK